MKKTIFILILVVAILTSVITGTLAVYQTSIDEMTGDVIAKKFEFTGEGSDGFGQQLKIAPSENVTFAFSLNNFKEDRVSEVPMLVEVTVTIEPIVVGKSIVPLVYKFVKIDENGNEIGYGFKNKVEKSTTVKFFDYFPLQGARQTFSYKIKVDWNSTSVSDIDYKDCANRITINATATQMVLNDTPSVSAEKMKTALNSFLYKDGNVKKTNDELKAEYKLSHVSNDILKRAFQENYGAMFPIIVYDKRTYLIQPCFFLANGQVEGCAIYAGLTDESNWNSPLYYNDVVGVWRESFKNTASGGTTSNSLSFIQSQGLTKAEYLQIISSDNPKIGDKNYSFRNFVE